jgi:hypothetical protein
MPEDYIVIKGPLILCEIRIECESKFLTRYELENFIYFDDYYQS